MSESTSVKPSAPESSDVGPQGGPQQDPLLAALRHLPSHVIDDRTEARQQRTAHAAFVRHAQGGAWSWSAAGLVGKVALPAFLACIVGLYMTWAIAAATAIVH